MTDEELIPCSLDYEVTQGQPGVVGIVVGTWLCSQSDDEDQAHMEVQGIGYNVGVGLKRDALERLLQKLTAVYYELSEKAS